MSVAVGVEYDGGVMLAWDQACTTDQGMVHVNGKGFLREDLGIGFALTGLQHDQLVRWAMEATPPSQRQENEGYLVTSLIPAMRKCFDEARIQDGEASAEWDCLVAIRGELWNIDSDYCAIRPLRGHFAIGSGAAYAMAALEARPILDNERDHAVASEWAEHAILSACSLSKDCGVLGDVPMVEVPS